MNEQIKALQDELQTLKDEAKALSEVTPWDDDQTARSHSLSEEIDTCKADLAARIDLHAKTTSADEFLNGQAGATMQSISADLTTEQVQELAKIDPDKKFRALKALKATGTHPYLSSIISDKVTARETAKRFGYFALASAPRTVSANSQFFLPTTNGRIAFSTRFVSSGIRPSSR